MLWWVRTDTALHCILGTDLIRGVTKALIRSSDKHYDIVIRDPREETSVIPSAMLDRSTDNRTCVPRPDIDGL